MKKVLAILLVLALSLSLYACGAKPQQTEPEGGNTEAELPVLRVALLPYMNAVSTLYAAEKGYDVEEGFKIETSVYTLGAPMLEALASDSWDVGQCGTGAAPMAVTTYGCKIVGDITVNCNMLFIRADSDMAKVKGSVADCPEIYGDAASIKGKTVLVPTGAVQQQLVILWLQKLGLTQNDVNFVNMDVASAYQAFIAGEGDIIACAPPYNFKLLADDAYVMGADFEMLGTRLADVVLVNPAHYEENYDLIVKYLKCIYRAQDELSADPELCAQKTYEWKTENAMETDIETCRAEVEATEMVTSATALDYMPGSSIKTVAGILADLGNLDPSQLTKFDDALTDAPLKEALK